MTRVIAQMWLKVGMRTRIETIAFVQYQERLRAGTLPEVNNHGCGNISGDPEMYAGVLLDPKFPFSAWKSDDVSPKRDPLFVELDQEKRYAGHRESARYAVENCYSIPTLQGVTANVYQRNVAFVPYANGWIRPNEFKPV